jgi:polyisoprenoid-binding protein YceI
MLTTMRRLGLVVLVLIVLVASTARAADTYAVDPVHSSVSFMISHAGISYIHGRFDDFTGNFTIDKSDPAKSSFELSIKVDSVDTNNKKRDEHLRAPDFFNAKQFPVLTFKSTKVKAVEGGYEVSGDLTLHGVKKPVTFTLKGGDKTVEFPKGMQRLGFIGSTVIKRSDFDMKAMLEALGDDVHITFGVEGVKQ